MKDEFVLVNIAFGETFNGPTWLLSKRPGLISSPIIWTFSDKPIPESQLQYIVYHYTEIHRVAGVGGEGGSGGGKRSGGKLLF